MFVDVKIEMAFNNDLRELQEIAHTKNKCVGTLTGMDGNCLFESLIYHKVFTGNIQLIRRALSGLLYYLKDEVDIFNNGETRTVEQLFNDTNEIEYVLNYKDDKVYKYDFATMCVDLATDKSWTRLPTMLLLMLISKIYNTTIVILKNTSTYEIVIDSNLNNSETRTIHLGNINETHYVPLDNKNEYSRILEYDDAKREMRNWVMQVERIFYDHELQQRQEEIITDRPRQQTIYNTVDIVDTDLVYYD